MSRASILKLVYMVTFPKKYSIPGFSTVRAPRPSHKLSKANRDLRPIFVDWYKGCTKERPNSIILVRYCFLKASEKRNNSVVAKLGSPS